MRLQSIDLNKKMLSSFDDAIQKEWVITNGLGGYASSTILGINTRKYHGLLVAALHPPGDRKVCLVKLDEDVKIRNNVYPLGANEFQNIVFPKGFRFLESFSVSPFPKYKYSVDGVEIQKTIFMPYGKNATITIYKIMNVNDVDVGIQVYPLVNWRHFHSITNRWDIPWKFVAKQENKEVAVSFDSPQSTLMMATTDGHYFATEKWIEKIYYREEAKRGESCLDDCYQHGYFEINFEARKKGEFAVIAVAEKNMNLTQRVLTELPSTMYDVEKLYDREIQRYKNLLMTFYEEHEKIKEREWLNWMILATNTFIARKIGTEQSFVVAGYHWFGTWGRDTFISLPGLMLATGRLEEARQVFLTFKNYCEQGLIPNFLPDQIGQPAYNTADATLWYVNAVLHYLRYTHDFKFVRDQLWETLKKIIKNHVRGTDFNIHVDNDGLLCHGPQLTWMDAAIDGKPVNPRVGKAVEVQALWYNALKIMELLAVRWKEREEAEEYAQLAKATMKSFTENFWNPNRGCLLDVINEYQKDDSLRPNQIFAVALDFTMLDKEKSEKIVDTVYHELLTPYGLRSLSRNDPRYVGVYTGDRRSRDEAYHNGTVWPWLLGPFTTAFLKVKGYMEYRREYALKTFLTPLLTEQIKSGLGVLSEIFDGDSPHTARGCIAQAWSVAEPLRAYVEDVLHVRPKFESDVLPEPS